MNNVIKTSSKGARQGGIGLKNILDEDIFTNVIYYTEFTDGRKYVGQTIQGFLTRHKKHLHKNDNNHYNNVLKAHMDEAIIYPICFGVEDIEDIDTVDLLNGLEIAEIMLRETFNDVDKEHGLNHTTGGGSYKRSESSKQKQRDFWTSEEGQKQKEEQSKLMKTQKHSKKYWDSEEGQKQKEKMSNERRVEVNAENILNYIDKYMTINETAKELNISTTKITNELRRQGYDRFNYLRNQAISEDLIKSKMTINEFATKHNIRTNDIKKALTQTGKKYMIKALQ